MDRVEAQPLNPEDSVTCRAELDRHARCTTDSRRCSVRKLLIDKILVAISVCVFVAACGSSPTAPTSTGGNQTSTGAPASSTGSHAVTGPDTGASSGAITGTWSGARTAWSGSGARANADTGARVDVRWLDQSGALVRRADTTRPFRARDRERIGTGRWPHLPDPVAGARQRLCHRWQRTWRSDADPRSDRRFRIVEMDV